MKYEMIFGDEKLFDGAPDDAIFVIRDDSGCFIYGYAIKTRFNFMSESKSFGVAMRRIIKEPKRWTWEDKKAGRLPEVGAKCRQGHKDEIVVAVTEKFVVTECQDMSVCTTRKDVFMRSYNPIETPAEKAQREEDEFISDLYRKSIQDETFEQGARAAYRKLKGGESER